MTRTSKRKIFDRTELRRWCIERAIQWPVIYTPSNSMMGGGQMTPKNEDADIIGRADRILQWVIKGS